MKRLPLRPLPDTRALPEPVGLSPLERMARDLFAPTGEFFIDPATERIILGAATAPLTGTGIFIGLDGADYEFRAGDPTGDYIHWDGTNLEVSGAITATSGEIGGWTIATEELSSGSVKLQSTAERLLLGSATAPMTGAGIFIGKDGVDYEFRVGNPSGQYLHWDGSALTFSGNLSAAGGTFTGDITGATGTFGGVIVTGETTVNSMVNLTVTNTLVAGRLDIDGAGDTFSLRDSGTAGATEAGWVECRVGAATHYIRTFLTI